MESQLLGGDIGVMINVAIKIKETAIKASFWGVLIFVPVNSLTLGRVNFCFAK